MTTYHKDIDKNGKAIYYKFDRNYNFRRVSKKKAELEIATGAADVTDYYPWKPESEMTDRQLRAKLAASIRQDNESGIRAAREELQKRGALVA